jgi:ectoine hydroxylase-related dioxygenase (phytanoyl-CoA dioxygenase family)
MASFEVDGYCIVQSAVPETEVESMRRILLLEIVKYGLPKDRLDEYHNTKTWFPSLREYVVHLADYVPSQLKKGELCEPQILLHFPDENLDYEIEPHRDQEPEWANGRKYTAIAGVALTDSDEQDGGLVSWGMDREPCEKWDAQPIELYAGDVIIFDPRLWHSGGLNSTDRIREVIYFRWVEYENHVQ